MPEGEPAFVADAAWRLDAPPRARDRSRLVLAALGALLIESAVFGVIGWERSFTPPPPLEEIPVEVVVEPPPPPPSPSPEASPTPTPEPTPSPELKAPDDEKPATEAPREGKSDHDDDSVGPKEKPAAPPSTPLPTPEPAKPPEASPEPTPSPEPPQPSASPEPTPSPEASKPPETPAPELPQAMDAEAPPPAKEEAPKPPAPPTKPTTVAGLPKTFADVPDVDFGGAAVKSDVTGGNAKAGFLPSLFGLIQPRMHVPPLSRAYGRPLVGVLVMVIDGRGRLLQRYIREPSGSMELDEAAMEAVGAAARGFPPPPTRKTVGVEWHYTNN